MKSIFALLSFEPIFCVWSSTAFSVVMFWLLECKQYSSIWDLHHWKIWVIKMFLWLISPVMHSKNFNWSKFNPKEHSFLQKKHDLSLISSLHLVLCLPLLWWLNSCEPSALMTEIWRTLRPLLNPESLQILQCSFGLSCSAHITSFSGAPVRALDHFVTFLNVLYQCPAIKYNRDPMLFFGRCS